MANPFPNSTKQYIDGRYGVRVPVREIALSGGEEPLRVYDSSGPQGHDVREGLPPLGTLHNGSRPPETKEQALANLSALAAKLKAKK